MSGPRSVENPTLLALHLLLYLGTTALCVSTHPLPFQSTPSSPPLSSLLPTSHHLSLSPPQAIISGQKLLAEIFKEAERKSIVLILISSLKDAALFLREHQSLFQSKIKHVTIMGGVKPFDDSTSFLEPDTAQNNAFDEQASKFFYRRCQDLGIPMVILSRVTAYACPMTKGIFDSLEHFSVSSSSGDVEVTNSPVGRRLKNAQKTSIENLWARARAPPGDEARFGLPDRCDAAWFSETFCGGKVLDLLPNESVWDHVLNLNMYDPMAVIAAVPALRDKYFNGTIKKVNNVEHMVIGTNHDSGIVPFMEDQLLKFMVNGFFKGLKPSDADLGRDSSRGSTDTLQSHGSRDSRGGDIGGGIGGGGGDGGGGDSSGGSGSDDTDNVLQLQHTIKRKDQALADQKQDHAATLKKKDQDLKKKDQEVAVLRAQLSALAAGSARGQSLDRPPRSSSVDARTASEPRSSASTSGFQAQLEKQRKQQVVASAVSRRRSYSEQRQNVQNELQRQRSNSVVGGTGGWHV